MTPAYRYKNGIAVRVLTYERHAAGIWYNNDTGERVDSDVLSAHLEELWLEKCRRFPFEWWGMNIIYKDAAL